MNIKKYIAVILVLVILMLTLTACGNMQLIDTNWNFDYAYVNEQSGWKEFEITSWINYDDGDMVQFTTINGNTVLGHSSVIILAKNRIDFN